MKVESGDGITVLIRHTTERDKKKERERERESAQ
jgi:hypothetical protein